MVSINISSSLKTTTTTTTTTVNKEFEERYTRLRNDFQKRIDQLSMEKFSLSTEKSSLESSINFNQTDIELANQEIQDLEVEHQNLLSNIVTLETEQARRKRDLEDFEKKLSYTTEALVSELSDDSDHEAKIQAQNKSILEMTRQLENLKGLFHQDEQIIIDLNKQLREKTNKVKELKSDISNLFNLKVKAEEEIDRYKSELNQLEEKWNLEHNENDKVEADIALQINICTDLEKKLSDLSHKWDSLDGIYNNLKLQVEGYENQHLEINRIIIDFEARLKILIHEEENLTITITTLNQEKEILQGQIDYMRNQISEKDKLCKEIDAKNKEEQQYVVNLKNKLSTATEELAKRLQINDKSEGEIAQLINRINEQTKVIHEWEKEIESDEKRNASYKETLTKRNETIDGLKKQIEELKAKYTSIKQNAANLEIINDHKKLKKLNEFEAKAKKYEKRLEELKNAEARENKYIQDYLEKKEEIKQVLESKHEILAEMAQYEKLYEEEKIKFESQNKTKQFIDNYNAERESYIHIESQHSGNAMQKVNEYNFEYSTQLAGIDIILHEIESVLLK